MMRWPKKAESGHPSPAGGFGKLLCHDPVRAIMILPSSPSPVKGSRKEGRDPAGGEKPMKRRQPLFPLPRVSGEVVSNTDKHETALCLDIRIHGDRSKRGDFLKSH